MPPPSPGENRTGVSVSLCRSLQCDTQSHHHSPSRWWRLGTWTTDTEMESVSRETSALILAPPEGERTTPAEVDVLADDRAEARSWSPNTRRAY